MVFMFTNVNSGIYLYISILEQFNKYNIGCGIVLHYGGSGSHRESWSRVRDDSRRPQQTPLLSTTEAGTKTGKNEDLKNMLFGRARVRRL